MKLIVPEILKVKLVDDWEAVTKNGQVCTVPHPPNTYISEQNLLITLNTQLVTLPRTPTVETFLHEFAAHVKSLPKPPPRASAVLPTVVSGLRLYFDRAIGTNLLYRFERPQYAEIRKKYVTGPTVQVGQEKEMSAIYGAEHFLRMLGSLRPAHYVVTRVFAHGSLQ